MAEDAEAEADHRAVPGLMLEEHPAAGVTRLERGPAQEVGGSEHLREEPAGLAAATPFLDPAAERHSGESTPPLASGPCSPYNPRPVWKPCTSGSSHLSSSCCPPSRPTGWC